MKSFEDVKLEIAQECGESDFDFLLEEEINIGDYQTAKKLWDDVFNRYITQFENIN